MVLWVNPNDVAAKKLGVNAGPCIIRSARHFQRDKKLLCLWLDAISSCQRYTNGFVMSTEVPLYAGSRRV